MLGTGYFLKIEKINSQQEKPTVLIAKISSRKTQKKRKKKQCAKINSRKNFLPRAK